MDFAKLPDSLCARSRSRLGIFQTFSVIQNYLFKSDLTIANQSTCMSGCAITKSMELSFNGIGKRVTGVGGNAIDVNGTGKGGLKVGVDGTTVGGIPASPANPNAATRNLTGFYFVAMPANNSSTVRL